MRFLSVLTFFLLFLAILIFVVSTPDYVYKFLMITPHGWVSGVIRNFLTPVILYIITSNVIKFIDLKIVLNKSYLLARHYLLVLISPILVLVKITPTTFPPTYFYKAPDFFEDVVPNIFVAISEEVIFRAWLYNAFLKATNNNIFVSISLTTILFSFTHFMIIDLVNGGDLPISFYIHFALLGFILTFTYHISESLLVSIMLHCIMNLSVISYPLGGQNLLIIISIFACIATYRKKKNEPKLVLNY